MIINQEVLVQVNVTPEKLAELFCDMDEAQMADFFNYVADEVKSWDTPFCMQVENMIATENLKDSGRQIMRVLGEYSGERRP